MKIDSVIKMLCAAGCAVQALAGCAASDRCVTSDPAPAEGAGLPAGLEEVRIGWFGPDDKSGAEAAPMWRAASLAIEEANRAGGFRGRPFRFIATWSENPWGTGINSLARLVYDQNVWAIVGAPDSASAHLVEQVVAKARLPFVSPASTDRTANLANVPWIFSCAPGDHLLAPVLAETIVRRTGSEGIAVVSTTDHGSRRFTAELLRALSKRRAFPAVHLTLSPGQSEPISQVARLRDYQPTAVAVIAGAGDSAGLVSAVRNVGLRAPIFGGPTIGQGLFAELAGPAAEGVEFPLLWHREIAGERSSAFARLYEERFGGRPDYTAACAYDAVSLLVDAIRRGGLLDRERIRDALHELSGWPGVTGAVAWDGAGQNSHPPVLGVIRDGRSVPSAPAITTSPSPSARTCNVSEPGGRDRESRGLAP